MDDLQVTFDAAVGQPIDDEFGVQIQNAVVEKPKKKMRNLGTMKQDHLLDKNKGLAELYMRMKRKKEDIIEQSLTNPAKAMSKYMRVLREWSFNMNSKYELQYLLERTRKLTKLQEVATEVGLLRRVHKGQLGIDHENNEFTNEQREVKDEQIEMFDERPPPNRIPDEALVNDRIFEAMIEQEDLEYQIKKTKPFNRESHEE